MKCFLHISFETQRERLLARLDDPAKHWKFKEADIDERQLWPAYQEAYERALRATSTEAAPWYVVPSDRKWYRNWAVAQLLRESMDDLHLEYPVIDLDVDALRARLAPAELSPSPVRVTPQQQGDRVVGQHVADRDVPAPGARR